MSDGLVSPAHPCAAPTIATMAVELAETAQQAGAAGRLRAQVAEKTEAAAQ
jgi:hypothetical protein